MADKVYQAIVDLTFEGLKPPLRVESGAAIPKKVPQSEITQLLADGHIREIPIVIKTTEESEGENE
jgi:hypothetical protein